jgi:GT2 family glycosyltransferase
MLPALAKALKDQTHPVDQVVAVDTASRDRSGAVLAELFGQDTVFGVTRSAGFGEAVAAGLRNAQRQDLATAGSDTGGMGKDPAHEWIWLLHDDCEPVPDTLERLLQAAHRDPAVAVAGPKVLDAQDRRTLREVGISIDRAGRRVTGIDPGEIDQGQHDHKRDVLAVSSAGMLVRRDVWDRLGGFDQDLRLFRDDLDFCWRVQGLGMRVHVVTDAILYHHELAGRRRRDAQDGSVRIADRRNALYVLAVNLPLLSMLRTVGGAVLGALLRAGYYLITKQPEQAAANGLSVANLFAHPVRLFKARRRRSAGIAEAYYSARAFIPPARSLSKLAETISGLISSGPPQASGGRHQAFSEQDSEEDAQFVDEPSAMRRIIAHPGVQLFLALLIVTLIATRRLLSPDPLTDPLGGGALVPAWSGASALWQEYLAGFHAVGVGTSATAPPYLAAVALLGTVFGGSARLAVDVLLLGCVPLAGMTAYAASRWVARTTPARVLLAASYALAPVATGAVAAGRLGTAVAFVLLPTIAVSAGRVLTAPPRQARRAAWAAGLLIGVAAAFAPVTWVLGAVFAIAVFGIAVYNGRLFGARVFSRTGLGDTAFGDTASGDAASGVRRWCAAVSPVHAAIVAVVPFFVLFPWSLSLLSHPSSFLTEVGVAAPTTRGLAATALLALSPGGPGVPPVWATIGFAIALVALVLPARRLGVVIGGWAAALTGLVAAVLLSRVNVAPAGGGSAESGWPGVALALAALGLLVAAAPVADWLADVGARSAFGAAKRATAVAVLVGAATAPVIVAGYWVKDGVQGPISKVSTQVLPSFVAASSGAQDRTLVLRADGSALDYQVLWQGDPSLGQPDLGTATAASAALSREVAALGTPDTADAGDPGTSLGSFGIKWVMLPAPVSTALATRLDAVADLEVVNSSASYDMWQVTGPVGQARVIAPSGGVTVLTSGAVGLDTAAPASGGTLVLAEPYGGWTAKLNGQALKPVTAPVDGWAQGFVLPPGGGTVTVTRSDLARTASLILELLATLAIIVAALPGKRSDPAEEAEALAALRETRARAAQEAAVAGTGGRAVSGARLLALGRRGRSGTTAEAPADDLELGDEEAASQGEANQGGLKDPTGRPETAGPAPAGAAPWDMAGDRGSRQGTPRQAEPPTRVTGSAPAFAEPRAAESAKLSDDDWLANLLRENGVQPSAAAAEPAREEPAMPDVSSSREPAAPAPAPYESLGTDSWAFDSPALSMSDSEPRLPWETDPGRVSRDSGVRPPSAPVEPVSESRAPWETDPKPQPSARPETAWGAEAGSAWATGPLPASRGDAESAAATQAQPTGGTGAQPTFTPVPQPTFTPTGPTPAFTPHESQPTFTPTVARPTHSQPGPQQTSTWSGPQPTFTQPTVTQSGPQPSRTPSGEYPTSSSWAESPSGERHSSSAGRSSGTGPRTYPASSPGEQSAAAAPVSPPEPRAPWAPAEEPQPESAVEPAPEQSDRPERHSHRAAKHGKPSRWRSGRGSGAS